METKTKPIVDLSNLEHVECNLCKSDDYEIIGDTSRFDLPLTTAICRKCGLIYINPRLTKEDNDRFYEEAYRQLIGQADWPMEKYIEDQQAHARLRILAFCEDQLPIGGRALDIGCSTGGILKTLKEEKGYEIYGIEPSVAHSTYAAEHCGVKVFTDVFDGVQFERGFFDVVVLTQVLNHLLDPLAALEKVRYILKPNGKAYLEIFNFVERTKVVPYRDAITIDHPYMFCEESARAMLSKAGFEILKITTDHAENRSQLNLPSGKKIPRYHTRVLVQPAASTEQFPNYHDIKAQVKRGRGLYFRSTLRRGATYRHYVGVAVKSVLGKRVFEKLRSMS